MQEVSPRPALDPEQLRKLDAYWRAANYLAVGQIYLAIDNPLLREPLQPQHIKSMLLGHWGMLTARLGWAAFTCLSGGRRRRACGSDFVCMKGPRLTAWGHDTTLSSGREWFGYFQKGPLNDSGMPVWNLEGSS